MADLLTHLRLALADRYTLERELGGGGMATVYLARDRKHDRDVALKVLRPELAAVLGAERFLQEIRISAKLDHPHILTLIDSGTDDGLVWYVLPLVRGESLRAKLTREKQLRLDEALTITKQIAGALDYAHRDGVIHRDIKPENILLHEGEAMLADFGIALAVKKAAGNRLTETGLSLGTPQYMSPEQATGDRQLDARSDIYSLGAVLYEMLAGEPPFSGATTQAVIAKLLTERPTRLRVIRPAVPPEVEEAVGRALEKNRADRLESAAQFVAALEKVGAQPRRLLHRRWRIVLGAMALLALAAVAVSRIVGRRAPGPVVQRQFTFIGKATLPKVSPDGQSVAYVSGGRSLVVQRFDRGEAIVLVPPVRFIISARWTGDGKAMVLEMFRDSTELAATYLVPSNGGPARKVLEDIPPFDAGPDSTLVVRAPREAHRLEFVSLVTRHANRTIPLPDSLGEVTEVAWSPDRRWVAFKTARRVSVGWTAGRALWVVRAEGGVPSRLVDEGRSIRWAPGSDALYFLRGPAGAVDLMKINLERNSGRKRGDVARMMSLPAADAFDVATTNRLVYTQTSTSRQVHALVFGGTPRRVMEDRPLTQGTAQVGGAVISADGQWVAYSQARGSEAHIYIVPFAGGSPQPVAASPAQDAWPTWSPDGSRVAFTREDSTGRGLMVADVRSGTPQRVGSLPGAGMYGGSGAGLWSADGRYVAYYAQDLRRIGAVDLPRQTESAIQIPDSVGTGYFLVVPSPDGRELIASTVVRATDWGELWLVTGDGRRWRRLRGPFGESSPIAWNRDGWIYLMNDRALFTDYGPMRLELWRMRGPDGRPEFYAPLPEGCDFAPSISADAQRGVCAYERTESDLYIASNFDPAGADVPSGRD